METRHEGCMGPRPRGPRFVHWQLDEAQRLLPPQPRTWWLPPPPPTSYAIPKRNYYREYLERRSSVSNGWLTVGPYDINALHQLLIDMVNARRRDNL